jgi:hypothetical protein
MYEWTMGQAIQQDLDAYKPFTYRRMGLAKALGFIY